MLPRSGEQRNRGFSVLACGIRGRAACQDGQALTDRCEPAAVRGGGRSRCFRRVGPRSSCRGPVCGEVPPTPPIQVAGSASPRAARSRLAACTRLAASLFGPRRPRSLTLLSVPVARGMPKKLRAGAAIAGSRGLVHIQVLRRRPSSGHRGADFAGGLVDPLNCARACSEPPLRTGADELVLISVFLSVVRWFARKNSVRQCGGKPGFRRNLVREVGRSARLHPFHANGDRNVKTSRIMRFVVTCDRHSGIAPSEGQASVGHFGVRRRAD